MRMLRTQIRESVQLSTDQPACEAVVLPEFNSKHSHLKIPESDLISAGLTSDFLRSAAQIIRPGDVVVEIGCGRGEHAMALGRLTGAMGCVIGIETSPEAIAQARKNASEAGMNHLEFYLCRVDTIPLPAGAADCVLSEGLACSVAGKMAVFREIFRALKPGGRMLIHDIAVKKLLPPEIADSMAEYACGLAGAIEISSFNHVAARVGFGEVRASEWDLKHRIHSLWEDAPSGFKPKIIRFNNGHSDNSQSLHLSDPESPQQQEHWLSEFITGVRLEAVKPLA
ncbi:MAG TPA: methyltransferase domain-containing protein, partial [Phycisphaerae bacterium]|nr:methyltransferase domain-containing protein [Phycisphaerae bacterium]